MRMTVGQLRRIIRETVEEEMMRRDLNEGLWDSIKDFFGGKKINSYEASNAMGPWKGSLPHGFEDFKDIFEAFQYSDGYDQEFAWNRLKDAAQRFIVDVSKGKIKAQSMQSLKNLANYIEQGNKGSSTSAVEAFVRANAKEIRKVLFQNSYFKEAYEKVTGKSREAEEKIGREKSLEDYKKKQSTYRTSFDTDDGKKRDWNAFGKEKAALAKAQDKQDYFEKMRFD